MVIVDFKDVTIKNYSNDGSSQEGNGEKLAEHTVVGRCNLLT